MTKEKEKNKCGKMRKIEEPYEIWTNNSGWEWRVLKKYQTPSKEAENPYARWMCAVKSPFTYGGYDYGDTYVKDVTQHAKMIMGDADLRKVLD